MAEHTITRRVLGERCGHVRAVGRKLKGVGNSTSSTAASHANFAPGSSSFGPSYEELAAARAESQLYKQRLETVEQSMTQLITQVQYHMPDL